MRLSSSSASANTFLRAATLIVAPNKVHDTLVSMNHSSFLNIYKVTAYLDCPPAASSHGRALPRPALDSASVRRLWQHERSQPAATPAYSHRHVWLVSCESYLILCPAFLSEHRTESQGLLSVLWHYFYLIVLLTSKPIRSLVHASASPLFAD